MYIKKSSPHTFFVLLNIVMILATLISSSAYPTHVHALGTLITVTTTSDNTLPDGVCSLREAIENANANAQLHSDCAPGAADDTINFDSALGTATIMPVGSGLPPISDTHGLIIDGGGKITISGNNLYRVFLVNSAVPLTLNSLTITSGRASNSDGAGAYNNGGSLTITNSIFSGNNTSVAGTRGGGVYNNNGTLTITKSTFSGNSADEGGGVFNFNGIATITNSTFSSNSAISVGGGVGNLATLTIKDSTINGNIAANGGGIYNTGFLNQYNIIIANSTGGDCVNKNALSGNNNLIKDTGSAACGLTNGIGGNIIGSDPALGTLAGSPAYFPLMAGSPAINAGDDTICAASPVSNASQNGVTRLQGPHCDIGSYEFPDANGAPTVSSIVRVNPNPTKLTSVDFALTFSESVTGVDGSDFKLTTSGASGAAISGFSGTGSSYTVTVNTGTTNGSIRLDMINDGSIKDVVLNPLAAGFTSGEAYTVVKAATFADVPLSYWANEFIERLYNAGITGGCSVVPLNYCPDNTVTRAQMAVFLLKGMHGSSFTPPDVGGSTGFSDVATSYWAAAWIKQLAAEGITGGCGAGIYCPDATVTRAQMAVFLLKAKHGSSYPPPNATGIFSDVSVGYWAASWIEQLAAEGVTSGCGAGIYCPDADVTRAQMAVFLVKAFSLP